MLYVTSGSPHPKLLQLGSPRWWAQWHTGVDSVTGRLAITVTMPRVRWVQAVHESEEQLCPYHQCNHRRGERCTSSARHRRVHVLHECGPPDGGHHEGIQACSRHQGEIFSSMSDARLGSALARRICWR